MATRFNPKAGCLKSWDNPRWPFPVIIDNMMNLELLFRAAAIAASALFELSDYGPEPAIKDTYAQAARKILRSLCAPPYLAEGTNSRAILNHSVGSKPGKGEVDVSLIYADYYFLEARARWKARVDILSRPR